jgi:hypothetical protein
MHRRAGRHDRDEFGARARSGAEPAVHHQIQSIETREDAAAGQRNHRLREDDLRLAVCAAPVHAVQLQAVQVDVEIGGRARALDQRDDAAIGLVGLHARQLERKPSDHAVHDLQHGRHKLGLCGQQRRRRGIGSDRTH